MTSSSTPLGRPSVPPEMLLKALLLQILFSIRSERQLVEAVNCNLLYRWFVGLNIEDKVWDHSTFSANRERLFNEDLARAFFERVKHTADWAKLTSDEHFSVDGTLIEAWASHKSFKRRDDDSASPPQRPNRRIHALKAKALLSGSGMERGFGSVFHLQTITKDGERVNAAA